MKRIHVLMRVVTVPFLILPFLTALTASAFTSPREAVPPTRGEVRVASNTSHPTLNTTDRAAKNVEDATGETIIDLPLSISLNNEPSIDLTTDEHVLLHQYSYPASIVREPGLDRYLRQDARQSYQEWLKEGRTQFKDLLENEELSLEERKNFRTSTDTVWVKTFEGERLIALAKEVSMMPGAHPAFSFEALYWNKAEQKRIGFEDLFLNSFEAASILRPLAYRGYRYEVARRNGAEAPSDEEVTLTRVADPVENDFTHYPIALLSGPSGKVEHFLFLLGRHDGYGAGEFQIKVPVSHQLLALVKPQYRSEFSTPQ